MLTISARALVIACALAVTLAVVANLLTPPMWAVYIAFAAIIGIFVVLNERHTERADPRPASAVTRQPASPVGPSGHSLPLSRQCRGVGGSLLGP